MGEHLSNQSKDQGQEQIIKSHLEKLGEEQTRLVKVFLELFMAERLRLNYERANIYLEAAQGHLEGMKEQGLYSGDVLSKIEAMIAETQK